MHCIVVSNGMQMRIVDANSEGNKAIVGKFQTFCMEYCFDFPVMRINRINVHPQRKAKARILA